MPSLPQKEIDPRPSLTCLPRLLRGVAIVTEFVAWWPIWYLLEDVMGLGYAYTAVVINVAYFAYKVAMLRYFGGRLGHLVVGARVVDYSTGGDLNWRQSFLRTLPEALGYFWFIYIVYAVMVFLHQERRHVGDLLGRTVVVKRSEKPTLVRYREPDC